MSENDFRRIPAVETLLQRTDVRQLVDRYGREHVKRCLREHLASLRAHIKSDAALPTDTLLEESVVRSIATGVQQASCSSLRPVINATGVILNTNLGRAPLGHVVAEEIRGVLEGYSNVEIDLESGERAGRVRHVLGLLQQLTGAEDAIVVNNNAAAVSLVMKTFADSRQVVVSRGELVEIGGSFRMPEIIAASGALMAEVGTTNRTHIADYERAITPWTAMLLKVHRSNFSMQGYTEEADIRSIAGLAHRHGLLCVYDLGSGLLDDGLAHKPEGEPSIRACIGAGADLVTFSCDKLLGGPQAGIIAGRTEFVRRAAQHPLMRTYRVDKIILAALSSVLRLHLSEQARDRSLPVYAMLSRKEEDVRASACELAAMLEREGIGARVVPSEACCGGGTLPGHIIPSAAVRLSDDGLGKDFAEKMHAALLNAQTPVVAVLKNGAIQFDMLTLGDDDLPLVAEEIERAYETFDHGHGGAH